MHRASRATRWLATAAVVLGTTVAVVSGSLGWRWVCAAALLVASLGEPVLHRRARRSVALLRRAGLGLLFRSAVRFAAVLALGGASDTPSGWMFAAATVGGVFLAMLGLDSLLRLRFRWRRRPVIETRNVPLDELAIPPAPPERLISGEGWLRAAVELPVFAGVALATRPATVWALGLISCLAVVAVATVLLTASHKVGLRLRSESMIPLVQDYLQRQGTRVILYFSGGASSAYQVNMWLATLEELDEPAAVVLRERAVLHRLGPTSLPVLCVPGATDFMSIDLSTVRVGLYAANVGKNIHLLRDPGLMHAFIGHGDSDKNASFNPVSKSFDEIWVAGRAGRERYRRADVGVRDDQVVEVGRPQLDRVGRRGPRPAGWVPTILYAPTWEGWNAEQEYGSLATVGPLLVRAILDSATPVRLIYRPHPFTGRRDPAMAAAHREVVAALAEANARRGLVVPPPATATERTRTEHGDAADVAVASGRCPGESAVATQEAASAADAAFFAAAPPGAHLVISSSGPSLFACFDAADLLVTDISSVLSDFIISDKPYAVCNPSEASPAEFVRTFPSAGAAVLVDRHGNGLSRVLGIVTGAEPDTDACARRELADDLLGAGAGGATRRFAEAVSALAARAEARNTRRSIDVEPELDVDAQGEVAESDPMPETENVGAIPDRPHLT
jgi:hypothetical protein